jgi:ribonuclease P protein component
MAGDAGPPAAPPGPGGGDERFRTAERLRRRADFLRCYRTGRRRQGALAIVYFIPNSLGHPRVGVTASRKVGNAVARHRLKRRIREAYRRWPERGRLAGLDVVVHLKPEARTADHGVFRAELLGLLQAIGSRREVRG